MLIQRAEFEPASVPYITTFYYACIQPIRVYTKVRIYINVLKLPQAGGGDRGIYPPQLLEPRDASSKYPPQLLRKNIAAKG